MIAARLVKSENPAAFVFKVVRSDKSLAAKAVISSEVMASEVAAFIVFSCAAVAAVASSL